MFNQLMANSRIAFNTLNVDAILDAKEYHLKIARAIVDGFLRENMLRAMGQRSGSQRVHNRSRLVTCRYMENVVVANIVRTSDKI